MMVLLCSAPSIGVQPHDYLPKLEGNWSTVHASPIWQKLGINPDAFEWREDIDPELLKVRTIIKYRDVDKDGFPDIFWSIYDGRHAYQYFAHATSPTTWKSPLPLGRCSYSPWLPPGKTGIPKPPMPSSEKIAGRVFLGVIDNTGRPTSTDKANTIHEFANGRLTQILRESGRDGSYTPMRWNIIPSNQDGDLLFYIHRSAANYADRYVDAWMLRAGESTPVRIEAPNEEDRITMSRANWRPPEAPANLHPLHPLRVAHELKGFPQDVVTFPIWEQLAIDPSEYDFRQDRDLTPEERADKFSFRKISTVPVYEDFNDDGLPDAYIVISQGFNCHWLIMLQQEPNQWTCAGIVGDIWYEHGFFIQHDPPTPKAETHAGRTFIISASGTTHDLGSEIRNHLYVIHNGKLHWLWDEIVYGHRHETQRLELAESDIGVVLTVKTWPDNLHIPHGKEPEHIRKWILLHGTTELLPLNEPTDD